MPLYLVDVVEEKNDEGTVISRGPNVPAGYNWSAAYSDDMTQCVINAADTIPGLTPITSGDQVNVEYDHLLVDPSEARPSEPVLERSTDGVPTIATLDDHEGPAPADQQPDAP